MKITLATHIVVEHVGNQVFLLDSVGKEVYCLPAEGITHYAPETKTLVVTPELVPEVTRLVDSGVATTTGLISRRAVVGSTGALIGGGLVAMSMPTLATASSGPIPFTGQWYFASDSGGGDPFRLDRVEFYLFFSLDDVTPLADADDSEPWTIQLLGRTFTAQFEIFAYYYETGFYIVGGGGGSNPPMGDPGDPFYDFWFRYNQDLPGTRELVATITAGAITVQILFEPTSSG